MKSAFKIYLDIDFFFLYVKGLKTIVLEVDAVNGQKVCAGIIPHLLSTIPQVFDETCTLVSLPLLTALK